MLPDKHPLTKEHLSAEQAPIFIRQVAVAINCQVKVNYQVVEVDIQELIKQDMKLEEI